MEIIDRKYLDVSTFSCHAGTICFYKNKPIYAWFGGTMEGNPDSAIYIQCDDQIYVIGDKDLIPRWNPVLFSYKDKLYLFVKAGRFCDSWATLLYDISDIFEEDFDIVKTKPQILPAGLNGPVKTKPIIYGYGDLIYCGSSVENILDWTSYIEVYELKDGKLKCRKRSLPLTVPKKTYQDSYYGKKKTMGIIQPSLYCDKKNKYSSPQAFFRSSRGLGKIYHSSSQINSFGDIYWPDPVATKLDNPNSGIDCVYTNDRLFLAHNPSSVHRRPLVISELDKNFNIIDQLVIQEKTDGITNSPELSYPYMVEHDGKLHLIYTYGRSKIETVTVDI